MTNSFLDSVCPFVKVFVDGDSGSGKGTLINALQNENDRLTGWMSGVCPQTAGIIPTEFHGKNLDIILYDFAGFNESHPIVLITVNISKSDSEIKKVLEYWQMIIANALSTARCSTHVHSVQLSFHVGRHAS